MRMISQMAGGLLLAAGMLVLAGGCSRNKTGTSNPFYRRGVKLRQEQQFREAAEAFHKCLRTDPGNGQAHMQLGTLYDDRLDAPVKALYHYKQCLELIPDDPNAGVVKEDLASIRRELVEAWTGWTPEVVDTQAQEIERLIEKNRQLEEYRASLLVQLRTNGRALAMARRALAVCRAEQARERSER